MNGDDFVNFPFLWHQFCLQGLIEKASDLGEQARGTQLEQEGADVIATR